MELIIEPFYSLPCELEVFTINGKAANYRDFGDVYEHNEEAKEPYGCGDMYFESKLPTSEVLQRYNITVDEYNTICTELKNKLYIGKCGWCI